MPTEKRMKYLARLEAKQTNQYTQAERQAEYDKVMGEFARLGISEESFEEVKDFATKARDWVTTGTPYSGSIPLIGLDRNLVYTLTTSKRNPCGVMLQNTKPPTDAQLEQLQQPSQAAAASKPADKQQKQQQKIISGPRNARAAQRPRPTGGSV
jgi:hypothetical protein